MYDLYAAVHHIGAMGGGHYVCTIREGCRPRQVSQSSTNPSFDKEKAECDVSHSASSDSIGSGVEEEGENHGPDRWWIYNDGLVTALDNDKEVCAASAYILFYMRRDVPNSSLTSLYPQSEIFKVDRSGDFIPKDRSTRRTFSEHATNAAGYVIGTGQKSGGLFGGGRHNEEGTLPKDKRSDCVIA